MQEGRRRSEAATVTEEVTMAATVTEVKTMAGATAGAGTVTIILIFMAGTGTDMNI